MLTIAPFEVGYSKCGLPPLMPATEARFTMLPRHCPSFFSIAGMAYCSAGRQSCTVSGSQERLTLLIITIDATLVVIPVAHSVMSTSFAVPKAPPTPTTLTRISSRPNCSTVASTAFLQSASLVTFAFMAIALPRPSCSIIWTVRSANSTLRSMHTTSQPASASRIAEALPLPMPSSSAPAPVTMATRPLSERVGLVASLMLRSCCRSRYARM